MAIKAIIKNARVVNIIEAEDGFEIPGLTIVPAADGVQIGGRYENGEFLPPEPAPEPVPTSVTMRQARLALLGAGVLDAADSAILAMTGNEGRAAQIEWEYATELRRDHPLVAGLGQGLGLDDAAVDALFVQAAQIA